MTPISRSAIDTSPSRTPLPEEIDFDPPKKESAGASEIQPLENLSPIFSLSADALVIIFKYATGSNRAKEDVQNLLALRQVCVFWRDTVDQFLLTDYWNLIRDRLPPLTTIKTLFKKYEQENAPPLLKFKELTKQLALAGPLREQPSVLLLPCQYKDLLVRTMGVLVPVWEGLFTQKGDFLHLSVTLPKNPQAVRTWLNDPENQGQIQHINRLTLNWLNLFVLPPEIFAFTHLETLDLANTRLQLLPDLFDNLPRLKKLNLNTTHISALPPSIGKLSLLSWLNLSGTTLYTLPPSIFQLSPLLKIEIANTPLICMLSPNGSYLNRPGFTSPGNELYHQADQIAHRHRICSEHPCQTPFSQLCQEIHKDSNKAALRFFFEKLDPEMKERILQLYAEFNPFESDNTLFDYKGSFATFIIDIAQKTYAQICRSEDQRNQMHYHVWNLAGRPNEPGAEGDGCGRMIDQTAPHHWGRTHQGDNIIRLIDAMELARLENLAQQRVGLNNNSRDNF